jgi:DNA polymerase III subunit delta'
MYASGELATKPRSVGSAEEQECLPRLGAAALPRLSKVSSLMLPIVGHEGIRKRISHAIERGALPSSLLLHGPPGAGKERLALWIAQRLLCATPAGWEPCGLCQHCSYVLKGVHPDLLWMFPLPKPKDGDLKDEDVFPALAEAIETRLEKGGVWPAPSPTDAIYVGMTKEIVRRAAFTPAMAARKVLIMADAHRMVAQEGSDQAANAFLKVLEEPSANTTIILTTSAASSLLPTIRSRVVPLRIPPLLEGERNQLQSLGLSVAGEGDSHTAAAQLFEAAKGDEAARYRVAFRQGGAGARGGFTASLDALTSLLHREAQSAARSEQSEAAAGLARAIALVEDAKRIARQNGNPQLITAALLTDLAPLVS